jgi:hypothetical protein
MCCFSRPIKRVSKTQIFARDTGTPMQVLVYSMQLALIEDGAMVLPLPVALVDGNVAAEDALQFIDLSGYPTLFEDLDLAFPPPVGLPKGARSLGFQPQVSRSRLRVHSVGAFEASFVPSPRDFDRLEPRFRLDPRVLERLPIYRDYGFAVFKLKRPRSLWQRLTGKPQGFHPMAFRFPRRAPDEVFFPTLHVHDGQVHAQAEFDHTLYLQSPTSTTAPPDWLRSSDRLGRFVDVGKIQASCDVDAHCFRRVLHGAQANQDLSIRLHPEPQPGSKATA